MSDERRDQIIQLIGYRFGALVSGNNMPHMSGDPRARIHPSRRRHFDDACADCADAILAIFRADAMSDDIVKRLREKRGVLDNRWPGPTQMDLEAADEIERLRAENHKMLARLRECYEASIMRTDVRAVLNAEFPDFAKTP